MNASALSESQAATAQGKNIGLLTKVTVVCRSLRYEDCVSDVVDLSSGEPSDGEPGTGISKSNRALTRRQSAYGMAMISQTASWRGFVLVVAMLSIITLGIAFKENLVWSCMSLWSLAQL